MRFLHTADWQIGMRALQAGARAQDIRDARIRCVERIMHLANERDVDFVVVAGDQFEDRAPAPAEVGAVVGALRHARMPVFVLPGNHDPARFDSPYAGAAWSTLAGSSVVTVMARGTYDVPGGVLLASPCTSKYSTEDPTAWFADVPTPSNAIRIGLAHGTLEIPPIPTFDENDQRGGFPIATNAASRGELLYLALGHFHNFLAFNDGRARISYSGTPEPTRFDDENCGTVSLVTIEGRRAIPEIERIPVNTYTWLQRRFELGDDASVRAAIEAVRGIPSPEKTLLRVRYQGLCSPEGIELLEAALAEFSARFFSFQSERSYAERPESAEAWRAQFPVGIACTIVDELLERARDPATEALALRALDLLLEQVRGAAR